MHDFPAEICDDKNDRGPTLFHLDNKHQLVEIIDRQDGYVLIKNHIPKDAQDYYTVGVDTLSGCPVIPQGGVWTNHFKADSLMAYVLGVAVYDKATKDWMSENY